MIKGLIFDYGGTLDSGGCHWGKMIWRAYKHFHIPVTEEQFRDAYVYGERTLARQPIIKPFFTFHDTLSAKLQIEMEWLSSEAGWETGEEEFDRCHKAVLEYLYLNTKNITQHSLDVLRVLRRQYPMVLVTNFYGNMHTVLQEFGFDGVFDDVIESAVVGVRKPDPVIYMLGVKALGLKPEETMVVGDSFNKDIIPAHKIGCHTVWFKGEGWTDETFDEELPDHIITDITQLHDCLGKD